ncbi:SDR family NAD(P)-dependent oxidoreductase [Nocardioides plantarum]|uniref:SDR family NAD(P)-dependent oxidoreductase n=1 Tax=Nocardioides plantarum TaxID=29299 RepID=A0ABV5KEU1_9ACTN|nr:SDR family oxidoreductase [Nocardioides plantarum]
MRRFTEQSVMITGATGGIGVAVCRRLAEEGAALVVTDVDEDACRLAVDSLTDPGRHLALALDVTDEGQWRSVVAMVEARGAGLAALINNAGIGSLATVEEETIDRWNQVVAVDQTGVWLGMKHAGALVERSGGGSIVNVCSILGTVGGFGNSVAYHAAKGAVRSMTKSAALHWATRGVRVNSLHPGFIGTDPLLQRFEGTERYRRMLDGTPMGRLGSADEVAAVVAFLASSDSSYMTGSEVYADGGWTAQ